MNAAFALDPSNTNTVAAICAQVDGLPLAIELAAARCKYFTPTHLLQKLESAKLTFLQGARDMPERHQTLHDAIAWSYDLLNSAERQLFRRLAIFVGGCTLEAVEQVCQLADDALAGCLEDCREDWLETLISLVDKNLIRQEIRTDGESKYLLLETLRAFATARLDESNDRWVLQQAHAEYYFELVNMNWPTAYWMTR